MGYIKDLIFSPDWFLAADNYPNFYNHRLKPLQKALPKLKPKTKKKAQYTLQLANMYQHLWELQQFQNELQNILMDNYILASEYLYTNQQTKVYLNNVHTKHRLQKLFQKIQNQLNPVLENKINFKQELNQCFKSYPPTQDNPVSMKLYSFNLIVWHLSTLNNIDINQAFNSNIHQFKFIKHKVLNEVKNQKQYFRYDNLKIYIPIWIHFYYLLQKTHHQIVQYYVTHRKKNQQFNYFYQYMLFINNIPNKPHKKQIIKEVYGK